MNQRRKPPSSRSQYQEFVLTAIESYKDTLAREDLLAIGDEAVQRIESLHGGQYLLNEILLLEAVDRIIMHRARLPSFAEWRRARGIDVVNTPLILDLNGRESNPASVRAHLVTVAGVSKELLRSLRDDPTRLYELPSRKFEELVYELLERQGFSCELTPISRDGGKDVVARLKTAAGSLLFYVECKKYGPKHRVGVGLVRELLGVVSHARVTSGLLVTTSSFTKPALELERCEAHRLGLRDYNHLTEWLRETDLSR